MVFHRLLTSTPPDGKSETIQIQSHPAGNEKQHAVETAMTLQDHIDRHKKRNSSQPAAQRKRDRNKYGPVAKQNQEKHLLWEIQSAAVGKDNETICAQDLSLRNPKWSLNITSVAPATSRTLPIGWREAGKSQMLANLILYLLQYGSCDQARRTMHLSTSWFLIPRCYRASQSWSWRVISSHPQPLSNILSEFGGIDGLEPLLACWALGECSPRSRVLTRAPIKLGLLGIYIYIYIRIYIYINI